jgi:tetratricopeptide (TPR) repeat protein
MPDSTQLVHQAIGLSDDEDYEGAITLLTKAIEADPRNAQAYFERAMALLNIDRTVKAISDFDNALHIDPNFPGARDWRARASESLGNYNEAASDRLAELRKNPNGKYPGMGVSPQDWADCAEAFIAAGDSHTARTLLQEYFAGPVEKVTSYQQYTTAPMRVMARLLLQAGELDRAYQFAADAAASANAYPADHEIHGMVLASRGQIKEAEQIYRNLTDGLPPGATYAMDLKSAIEKHK